MNVKRSLSICGLLLLGRRTRIDTWASSHPIGTGFSDTNGLAAFGGAPSSIGAAAATTQLSWSLQLRSQHILLTKTSNETSMCEDPGSNREVKFAEINDRTVRLLQARRSVRNGGHGCWAVASALQMTPVYGGVVCFGRTSCNINSRRYHAFWRGRKTGSNLERITLSCSRMRLTALS